MSKLLINKIIPVILLLIGFSVHSAAQPILKKIEGAKGRPGEIITLTLRGENLHQVVRIEKVRFDDDQIDVIGKPTIESDKVIKLQIRIPFNAEPNKPHKISVLVADSQLERWLDSSDETTVVQYKNPEIKILYDNGSIKKEAVLTVDFTEDEEGNFSSKTFTLKNPNDVPLSFSDLKLPPELTMKGTPPDNIPAKENFTFELQLKPHAQHNLNTQLQFSVGGNPITLQINGTAIPSAPLEPEVPDSVEKLVVIFDSTNIWSSVGSTENGKSLILRNIGSDILTVNQLQLPQGFFSPDSFPIHITANDSATIQVYLDTTFLMTFEGNLHFDANKIDNDQFDYQIIGKLDREPAPAIQISDGKNIVTQGQLKTVDFGTTPVGTSAKKTFLIRNTGLAPVHLSNLKLPEGLNLVGTFPNVIKGGATGSYTIELTADSAKNVNGNIEFQSNISGQNLIIYPITGIVTVEEMPTSPPSDFITTGLIILSLIVGGGGLYFLIKGPIKKSLAKNIASGTPMSSPLFQFKPKTDMGLQNIKQSVFFKKHFEVRLKPVLDFGTQRIDSEEPLIHIETISSQKSKSKEVDDLTRIEGIGSVISDILKKSEITTYLKLSETNPKNIEQVLHLAGITGIADPTTWPQQAKLAAAGKWEELDKLQKELKGGRIVHDSQNSI